MLNTRWDLSSRAEMGQALGKGGRRMGVKPRPARPIRAGIRATHQGEVKQAQTGSGTIYPSS